MKTFFTTTTGESWTFTFVDALGNVPAGFAGAVLTLWFRSLTTLQKMEGTGPFVVINASLGQAQYTVASSDLAQAYALASPVVGEALFEILAEASISGVVYDGQQPPIIKIRKV